ncbi:HAD family hydrolase [Corynebacterium mendelii]
MTCTTVLFDLDGTLVDHHCAAVAAAGDFIRQYARHDPADHGGEDPVARWMRLEEVHFRRYEHGEITHTQQRRERIRDFFGTPGIDDGRADELFGHFLDFYRSRWTAFPDAADALNRVRDKGLRVAIVTNGALALQKMKLERTGLFTGDLMMFCSAEIGCAKPDPGIYRHVLDHLDCRASEALMVGDNLANDVHAARRAGLQAIWLARYSRTGNTTGEPFIRSLADLPV